MIRLIRPNRPRIPCRHHKSAKNAANFPQISAGTLRGFAVGLVRWGALPGVCGHYESGRSRDSGSKATDGIHGSLEGVSQGN